MALISSVLSLPDIASSSTNSTTLGATTSTSGITVTPNRQIAINATGDMNIRFSGSASVSAATATDFRIPANNTFVFTISPDTTKMYFYNPGASSITYFWQYLSKF